MYACVDARCPPYPIVWFEPNLHEDGEPWDSCFLPLAGSIHEWLEAWLSGRNPMGNAERLM